jgi:hypothetical protein
MYLETTLKVEITEQIPEILVFSQFSNFYHSFRPITRSIDGMLQVVLLASSMVSVVQWLAPNRIGWIYATPPFYLTRKNAVSETCYVRNASPETR